MTSETTKIKRHGLAAALLATALLAAAPTAAVATRGNTDSATHLAIAATPGGGCGSGC
jgi:hypothetical protein